jgi:hypothetical protein
MPNPQKDYSKRENPGSPKEHNRSARVEIRVRRLARAVWLISVVSGVALAFGKWWHRIPVGW